jgi:hypothetical protein
MAAEHAGDGNQPRGGVSGQAATQGGDVWAPRLLVDLYHAQNLRDDGGISARVLRHNFHKKHIGQQGTFTLWAFKPGSLTLWLSGPLTAHEGRAQTADRHVAWDTIEALQTHGLLSFVPHLWDNDTEQSEILHAYGLATYGGEPIEIDIARQHTERRSGWRFRSA